MTDQQQAEIAALLSYLDDNKDGAEDVGYFAKAATCWHPVLKALMAENKQLKAELDEDTALVERAIVLCRTRGWVVDAAIEGWVGRALRGLEEGPNSV